MIVLTLSLLCVAAAAFIAAQRLCLLDADDHIAALNEALEEVHREVVMLRAIHKSARPNGC